VTIEPAEGIGKVEKHFPDQILGVSFGTGDPQSEAEHVRPMLFHECVERPRFAITDAAE
jgi:hypothetical protein